MELRVGIIGLGYVGLPLAISFAKKYRVIGFDLDKNRVKYLSNSIDNNLDLQKKELSILKKKKKLFLHIINMNYLKLIFTSSLFLHL